MNLQEYIHFLKKLGKKVYWIDGVPFSDNRPLVYWSLPRFATYALEPTEARRLLFTRALMVVYPTVNCGNTVIRFLAARGPDYDIKRLYPKKRTQTRRGLEKCQIRPVDWEEMRRVGLSINVEGLKRQQRRSNLGNPKWWDRQCRVSAEFSDVLAWGAFVNDSLTAYVHVNVYDDIVVEGQPERVAVISHFMSGASYLDRQPNEALIFTVTQQILGPLNCASVICGHTSDDPQLARWKRHMGFSEQPVACQVLANPVMHLAKHFVPKLRMYL